MIERLEGVIPTVKKDVTIGVIGEVLLLAVLGRSGGLSALGWTFGCAYAVAMYALVVHATARHDVKSLGPADQVTLIRVILVGGVTALTASSLHAPISTPTLLALTAGALLLDAVDGWTARRTGTESEFGARFDWEVDAFLILVLSVYVAGLLGLWVLALGLARYVFVAASWFLAWMRTPLPFRHWRKVVAAVVGVTLTVAASNLLPRPVNVVAVLVALGMLAESFGRDIWWLSRQRTLTAEEAQTSVSFHA